MENISLSCSSFATNGTASTIPPSECMSPSSLSLNEQCPNENTNCPSSVASSLSIFRDPTTIYEGCELSNLVIFNSDANGGSGEARSLNYLLKDSSRSEIVRYLHHRREREQREQQGDLLKVTVAFRHISVWKMTSTNPRIATIGSELQSLLLCGAMSTDVKTRLDALHCISGQLKPHRMTLLMGPPGCGRSLLMKLLSHRLTPNATASTVEGDIYYNGDNLYSGQFIPGKVVDYVDQKENHASLLTIEETLRYAWMCTTQHSVSSIGSIQVNNEEADIAVQNMLTILGLHSCKDTLVGDESTRGISGGEKRRLTLGEMLISNRPVKIMDSITDGLDAATAFDILRYLRDACSMLGHTYLIALQQAPPLIYDLFDDIILMSEGRVIYQGDRKLAKAYFESHGFFCPADMDEVEFLQEMATPDGGSRFYSEELHTRPRKSFHRTHSEKKLAEAMSVDPEPTSTNGVSNLRYGSKLTTHSAFLGTIWQESSLYNTMIMEINESLPSTSCSESVSTNKTHNHECHEDDEIPHVPTNSKDQYSWPISCKAALPAVSANPIFAWWFYFALTIHKYWLIEKRSKSFYKVRIYPTVIVGVLSGTIYQGIGMTDAFTMTGFLFFNIMVAVSGQLSMMPRYYSHQDCHFKFHDAAFYPTSVFTIAQSILAYPLFVLETIIGCVIQYWIVGLSAEGYGSRFAFFTFVVLLFTMMMSILYRGLVSLCAKREVGTALGGLIVMFSSLFSGFIQSRTSAPIYWRWCYYLNPAAWCLTALSINEYKSSRYDALQCTSLDCSTKKRFGDIALEEYGHPTEESYKWISVCIVVMMYLVMIGVVNLLVHFHRSEIPPAIPVRESFSGGKKSASVEVSPEEMEAGNSTKSQPHHLLSLPFEPITMTFQNVSYKVPSPPEKNQESKDIQLLSNVNGYFEPGTMTALMGSTGAGKTTLMDVLAARKNHGTCTGNICVNGKSIFEANSRFKNIMAYVEQFDALSTFCTAKEAISFSGRLRLPSNTTDEEVSHWIENVINMVELQTIQDRMIGNALQGGMSFEQRKRVSIALELAANPSIMFLDEPTTGLDSRSAEVVMHNIRTIASSGRTIVCTIHQPSPSVFFAFDKLLLLKKGGKVVYFGEVGQRATAIVKYFEAIPNSLRLEESPSKKNPATWMLECIGAGTCQQEVPSLSCTLSKSMDDPESPVISDASKCSTLSTSMSASSSKFASVDHHDYFHKSELFETSQKHLRQLSSSKIALSTNTGSAKSQDSMVPTIAVIADGDIDKTEAQSIEHISWWIQVNALFLRTWRSYWRNPGYNLFTRIVMNVVLSCIFASFYVQYDFESTSDVTSFVTVLLMSSVCCSILAMLVVVPITAEQRGVFYREQQSNMYSIGLYTVINVVIELPFILLSSLVLTLPFFLITGMNVFGGNAVAKFFYFWLLTALMLGFNIFYGQFLVAATSEVSIAQTFASLSMSIFSAFSGFMIKSNAIPPFWRFAYWANPFHYTLEAVITTQFHQADDLVTLLNGKQVTVGALIIHAFPDWHYSNVPFDILALVLFVVSTCILRYLCLRYCRHDKH